MVSAAMAVNRHPSPKDPAMQVLRMRMSNSPSSNRRVWIHLHAGNLGPTCEPQLNVDELARRLDRPIAYVAKLAEFLVVFA